MTIATGIVGDMAMAAIFAGRDMTAEGDRAANLDRRHRLELAEADMTSVGVTPCSTMVAEDIRDFQR